MIFDIASNRPVAQLRRALAPEGTLVIVGGEGGDRWIGGTHRQIGKMILSSFIPQNLKSFIAAERREDLLFLTGLIEAPQASDRPDLAAVRGGGGDPPSGGRSCAGEVGYRGYSGSLKLPIKFTGI